MESVRTVGLTALVFGSILIAPSSPPRAHASPSRPYAKATPCNTTKSCFTQTNRGTGSAIKGISLDPTLGKFGEAAILAQADGLGGMYAFSRQFYGGEFESAGASYALIAATDNAQGTAFLAEGPANGSGPEIDAISTNPTFDGESDAAAVLVNSNGLVGINAYSAQNSAGKFESAGNGTFALEAFTDGNDTTAFVAGGKAYATIDDLGDGTFDGTVFADQFISRGIVRGGRSVGTFSAQSAQASIEDTGTARLSGGVGRVRFDPGFLQAIDAGAGYQVFLTPDGETRGCLFIAQKFQGGFVVRESQGGRSSISFDYRIVARPAGATGVRLPELHLPKFPPRRHHAR